MSKTKTETNARVKVRVDIEDMDTYAQQKVDEFKEKLNKYLTEQVAERPTEYGQGWNAMINRIKKEFEL